MIYYVLYFILIIIIFIIIFIIIYFLFLNKTKSLNDYENLLLNTQYNPNSYQYFIAYLLNNTTNADFKKDYQDIITNVKSSSSIPNLNLIKISFSIQKLNFDKELCEMIFSNDIIKKSFNYLVKNTSFNDFYLKTVCLYNAMILIFLKYFEINNYDDDIDFTILIKIKNFFNSPLNIKAYNYNNVNKNALTLFEDNSVISNDNLPGNIFYYIDFLYFLLIISNYVNLHEIYYNIFRNLLFLNGEKYKDIQQYSYRVSLKKFFLEIIAIQFFNKNTILETTITNNKLYKNKLNDDLYMASIMYPYFTDWKRYDNFVWKILESKNIIYSRISNFKFFRNDYVLQICNTNRNMDHVYTKSDNDELNETIGMTQFTYIYYGGYMAECYNYFNTILKKPPIFSNQFIDYIEIYTNVQQIYYIFPDKNIIVLCGNNDFCLIIFYDVLNNKIYVNYINNTTKKIYNGEVCIFALYTENILEIYKISNKKYIVIDKDEKYTIEAEQDIILYAYKKLPKCYKDGNMISLYQLILNTSKYGFYTIERAKTQDKNIKKKTFSLDFYMELNNLNKNFYGIYYVKYTNINNVKMNVLLYVNIFAPYEHYYYHKFNFNIGQCYIENSKKPEDQIKEWQLLFSF